MSIAFLIIICYTVGAKEERSNGKVSTDPKSEGAIDRGV